MLGDLIVQQLWQIAVGTIEHSHADLTRSRGSPSRSWTPPSGEPEPAHAIRGEPLGVCPCQHRAQIPAFPAAHEQPRRVARPMPAQVEEEHVIPLRVQVVPERGPFVPGTPHPVNHDHQVASAAVRVIPAAQGQPVFPYAPDQGVASALTASGSIMDAWLWGRGQHVR